MKRAAAGASLLGAVALSAAAVAVGCGAPPAAPPGRADPRAAPRAPFAEPALSSPARYVLTDRMGALFDEAGVGSSAPRVEPAIVSGVRVLLDGGMIVAAASFPESIAGFRSAPKRFGSGYVIWSDARTYRAADFLGELRPIVDVAASGGVRPWLGSLLLRTERGVLELDPASLGIRRAGVPGLADAFALDGKRAVRLDGLGRAQITLDAGTTWMDALATRGIVTTRLEETADGSIALVGPSGRPELRLKAEGAVVATPAPIAALSSQPQYGAYGRYSRPVSTSVEPPKYGPQPLADRVVELQGTSRTLPSEVLAHAAFAGAMLPGDQLLVARDGGLRAFAAQSGRPVADGDMLDVAEPMRRCQPVRVGSDVLLACTHERGSHVMVIDGALDKPQLEATFPVTGGFVGGPRGRFGFAGRCGAEPPSSADFKPAASASPESGPGFGGLDAPPGEPPPPPAIGRDVTAADDVRFCARVASGQWVERRVRGSDARRLYRWIPGLDGSVVALVLDEPGGSDKTTPTLRKRRADERRAPARGAGGALAAPRAGASEGARAPGPDGAASSTRAPRRPSEGVRVVHLDPSAASLEGAMFPAVPQPMTDVPYRVVDADFWQDDAGGALRGWVLLPAPEGADAPPEPPEPDPGAASPAAVKLPVSARLGGRAAGVTIASDGAVTVHPLPDGVIEVVRGGRFALALAEKDDVSAMYESLDGGRTWRAIQAPPVGRIEAPSDSGAIHGCSEIGCTWGEGIVRLGWGGPPPLAPVEIAELTPAVNARVPGPEPIAVSCEIKGDGRALLAARGSDASPKRSPDPPSGKGGSPPTSPPPPITLRVKPSSTLGTFRSTPGRGGSWSAAVILPFRPGAAARNVSLSDPALTQVIGSVAPLLRSTKAGGGDAVDLVLLTDRRRFPLSSGEKLLPFDYMGTISAMIEEADGGLFALDADKGVLLYARGGAARPLLRLTRVPDVQRVRLTLAVRVRGEGPGPAIVGFSASSGEVFAGPLDPVRAEVGPLEALGSLTALRDAGAAECRGRRPAFRFLADIPVTLALTGGDSSRSDDGLAVTATALIEGDRERLCLGGLELRLSPSQGQAEIAASFGAKPSAALRVGAKSARAVCTIQGR